MLRLAEVLQDQAHLLGGIAVAVHVPVGALQRCHQLWTALDVLAQVLQRRLDVLGFRPIQTGQLTSLRFSVPAVLAPSSSFHDFNLLTACMCVTFCFTCNTIFICRIFVLIKKIL